MKMNLTDFLRKTAAALFTILIFWGCSMTDDITYIADNTVILASIGRLYRTNYTAVATIYDEVNIDGSVDEDSVVTDASVNLNGTELPYSEGIGYYNQISGVMSPAVLEVSVNGISASAALDVTETPVITSHSDGDDIDPAQDLILNWSIESDPDMIQLTISGSETEIGEEFYVELEGSIRSYTIPGGTISDETESATIQVLVNNFVLFSTAGLHPSSGFGIYDYADVEVF